MSTEKEQQEMAAALNARAVKLAEEAVEEARKAKGWRKWVYLALAALAGGIAYFAQGCIVYSDMYVLPIEQKGDEQ